MKETLYFSSDEIKVIENTIKKGPQSAENLISSLVKEIEFKPWLTKISIDCTLISKSILVDLVRPDLLISLNEKQAIWAILLTESCITHEQAIISCEELLSKDPKLIEWEERLREWPRLIYKLALLYNEMDGKGDTYNIIFNLCLRSIEIDPKMQETHALLVEMATYLGFADLAIESYAMAANLNPNDVVTRANYATFLTQSYMETMDDKFLKTAIDQFYAIVEIDPDDSLSWYQLYSVLRLGGKPEEERADKALKKALSLGFDPDKIDFIF